MKTEQKNKKKKGVLLCALVFIFPYTQGSYDYQTFADYRMIIFADSYRRGSGVASGFRHSKAVMVTFHQ